MAFTKFANVESILEVKSSNERLNYAYDEGKGLRFAKFAAMDEGIREEDGYLYVRCRAISSRVNKNNDGWPSKELDKSYKTFESRPIFVDHNNDDPKRTRGVIAASEIHVDTDKEAALDPYYATAPEEHLPATWIELLLEVDAKTYPKLAKNIREGKVDAVSMGANIDRSVCSVCAHEATVPSEYCTHIKKKGTTFEVTADGGEKIKKKAYEDCYGINFFEISFVFDPADPTADVLSKKGSTEKYSEDRIHELSTQSGIPFNELAAYFELQGEYDGPRGATTLEYVQSDRPLSEMVGQTLPMERVASLKRAAPLAEQFMVPKGQDPATDGKNKNYKPQSEMITAPQHVDTLRNDQRCPVCHAAEMETGADGIDSCPVCGHVQEPEPLNNPDLEIARDNMLRQDATPEGDPVAPANGDPLDTVQFDQEQAQQPQAQPTSKKSITNEGIGEMFTTTLRTTSKEEADAILPSKVARVEAKLGHGIHRGVYDAAREAGLTVKVAYPGVKSTEENSVEVPGDNGIFNLFFAEESALNLGIDMAEVPVVIEAASTEDAEKFITILAETPLPSRQRKAENDKQPILPNSKPSDEPKKETVIENPTEPVESKLKAAVTIDGIVELDGIKYRLEEIKDEADDADEPEDKPKEDEPKAEEKDEKGDEKKPEASNDDREARLLAAFKLADLSVEMGLVLPENKMAFIAELEEEGLEQLSARETTLNSVKTAGLSKRVANHPLANIKRVPRLSHAVPAVNGSGSLNNDVPDEALFL